jgi:hypothetical protein
VSSKSKKLSATSSRAPVSGGEVGASSNNSDDGGFEDVEATQKNSAENGTSAKQFEQDEKMAKQMQREMNSGDGNSGRNSSASSVSSNGDEMPTKPAAPVPAPVSPLHQYLDTKRSLRWKIVWPRRRLMDSDFFSDM